MRTVLLLVVVLASCNSAGRATPPPSSPRSPDATASTTPHTEQCDRVSAWMRTTLGSAESQSTLSGSSKVFGAAAANGPDGIDDPQLVDVRARATKHFAAASQDFALAGDAEKRKDSKGAHAAVDRIEAHMKELAAVSSQLRDVCATPK